MPKRKREDMIPTFGSGVAPGRMSEGQRIARALVGMFNIVMTVVDYYLVSRLIGSLLMLAGHEFEGLFELVLLGGSVLMVLFFVFVWLFGSVYDLVNGRGIFD